MTMDASLVGDALNLSPTLQAIDIDRVHLCDDGGAPIDTDFVEKMQDSIDRLGLIQPIGVKVVFGQAYDFEVVFGRYRYRAWKVLYERAWAAFEAAGRPQVNRANNLLRPPELIEITRWQALPAIVYSHKSTDKALRERRLAENICRLGEQSPRGVETIIQKAITHRPIAALGEEHVKRCAMAEEMFGASWPGRAYERYEKDKSKANNLRLMKSGKRPFRPDIRVQLERDYAYFREHGVLPAL